MGMVVFVALLMFMTTTSPYHHGGSVDLPKVLHPVAMRGADREDAITISITRDGRVYLGSEQIAFGDLTAKIQDRLKDREVERKVYVVADMRARWDRVGMVLDSVRSAGIIRVAFLAEQGGLSKLRLGRSTVGRNCLAKDRLLARMSNHGGLARVFREQTECVRRRSVRDRYANSYYSDLGQPCGWFHQGRDSS